MASGTYFADDDPPAQGEALAERPPAAETLVAQRRPATVVDLLFTSTVCLALAGQGAQYAVVKMRAR